MSLLNNNQLVAVLEVLSFALVTPRIIGPKRMNVAGERIKNFGAAIEHGPMVIICGLILYITGVIPVIYYANDIDIMKTSWKKLAIVLGASSLVYILPKLGMFFLEWIGILFSSATGPRLARALFWIGFAIFGFAKAAQSFGWEL